jgi:glycosyltransferase involved in cell wall biosynthesis
MNNKAAEILRLHGLKKDKVRIVQFAIDNDCFLPRSIRKNKTIILASKFSPRKGLHLLPDLVQSMPDWNFIVLGRDWENFVASTSLREVQNFTLHEFTKESRNKYFSEAFIFLSLSEIEGGPIPLLEAMAFGLVPVCTQTGFAPDLIEDGKNGVLLPSNFSILDIKKALLKAAKLEPESSLDFNRFTWDRLSRILLSDFQEISESFKRSQDVNSF